MKNLATNQLARRALAALVVGAAAHLVVAGPVWQESAKDAGSKSDDAQETDGVGALSRIEGELKGNTALLGTPDFEDMYVIRVCDPMAFVASTLGADGGNANFNTQLFLFRPGSRPNDLFGVLGNDDTAVPPSPRSRLLPVPTDGQPALMEPGIYFLAISGTQNRPLAGNNEQIFLFQTPTEISGPDGENAPLAVWSGPPSPIGTYGIALQGVTFASGVNTIDCNENGVHDACDIAFGDSADANADGVPDECQNPPDINDDGNVDTQDLLVMLGSWGACGKNCPADLNGDGVVDVGDLLLLLAAWST